MVSFPLLVQIICCLITSAKNAKRRAERRREFCSLIDLLGDLYEGRFEWYYLYKIVALSKKQYNEKRYLIRERLIALLVEDVDLFDQLHPYVYEGDKDFWKDVILSNPYALSFVPRNSKSLWRRMTRLAWRLTEERGLDKKHLLPNSVNVPASYGFVLNGIVDGSLKGYDVPECISRNRKVQMALAIHDPWYLPRRCFYEAKRLAVLSKPMECPISLFSKSPALLIEVIKEHGLSVLERFLRMEGLLYDNEVGFLEEKRADYDYSFEDGVDHHEEFPFNNEKVFNVVFELNPFCALNWFSTDVWKKEKFVIWRNAISRNSKAIKLVDPHEVVKFLIWMKFGTDISSVIIDFLGA